MKRMIYTLSFAFSLFGYAQAPIQTITASVRQQAKISSSDWIQLEHRLGVEEPAPLLASGFNKIESGDFQGAITDLTAALDNSKHHHEFIYLYRGLAKHALGQYKLATIDFTKSILINSMMADAYFRRAISKYEMADLESACRDLQKTLQPGRSLHTISSAKVHEVVKEFCNQSNLDSAVLEGIARY